MSNPLQSAKQRYGIIGRSPILDQALSRALRVAPTDLSVLITGESGVGKEVFSQIIHSQSARKHNNFIAVNCGAIPSGTINSELFGHEKGAFTGATSDRKGYFEAVDGGTIFLDEIGEMPMDTQSYLLRVLESGEFLRVGSSQVQKTDVRVIAATNQDLEDRVFQGKFRDDLYYRLASVSIQIPALRERREDIHTLFRKFALDFGERYRTDPVRLSEEAQTILNQYSFPGNIRELRNIAEQASVLSDENPLSAERLVSIYPRLAERHLPARLPYSSEDQPLGEREILYKLLFEMRDDVSHLKSVITELIRQNDLSIDNHPGLRSLQDEDPSAHPAVELGFPAGGARSSSWSPEEYRDDPQQNIPIILNEAQQQAYEESLVEEENLNIDDMEKDLIKKALERHRGKRRQAAEDLGISERTLYRKINEYNIPL